MATEREHKFEVMGAFPDVTQLGAAYAALGLGLRSQGVRDQHDVYYDTADLTLLHANVALRQRNFDGHKLATYKGVGVVSGSLHTREELEVPYQGSWPDAILAKLEPLGVIGALEPLIELSTQRQRYLLVKNTQTRAELTFDEVTSVDGGERVTFRELELEASPDTPDDELAAFTLPLTRLGLVPHAQDKLTHALTLLGRLEL